MNMFLISALCVCICALCSANYVVPPSLVEVLKPRGLRVSIPDEEGITLMAFHGNINVPFEGLDAGQMARDIIKKRGNRWVFEDKKVRLKEGDVLYYWIYVILDGLGYQGLDRSHRVTDFIEIEDPGITLGGGIGEHSCEKSNSTVRGVPPCKGYLVFEANFQNNFIDPNVWFQEEKIGGSDYEDPFVVFMKENSYVVGNKLEIKPSLIEKKYNEGFNVKKGSLFLRGCTSNNERFCSKTAMSWNIIPPVLTARISTKNSFSFKYGEVEIKAKLPQGDWIVPELWLEPKEVGNTGRIVIGLARGNNVLSADGKDISAKTLTAGVVFEPKKSDMKSKESSIPWTQDFHVYKVKWTYSGMTFLVDNREIGKISSPDSYKAFAPFNKEYYITLGVHVGGLIDFPDTETKSWRNDELKSVLTFWQDEDNWYKTWNKESKLIVEYVKVWAL